MFGALQLVDDRRERAIDATGEEAERRDDAERDHGKNHAVLSHRLTLFLLPIGAHVLEPVGERHVSAPPFVESKTTTIDASRLGRLEARAVQLISNFTDSALRNATTCLLQTLLGRGRAAVCAFDGAFI